ncbi:hypothetical protein MBLNU457_5154t1 [Dothideomycetes sp. NU457]
MDRLADYSSSGGAIGAIGQAILRFFQFVLAITVAALYGVDLHAAQEAHVGADGKWVFAEVVAGLSAVSCLLYGIPFLKSYWLWAWDFCLFVLWTALFGLFGSIYIKDHPTPEQKGQIRMKNAVWVDLANMLLWLITFVYGLIIWFRRRQNRTMHTGRAIV